MISVEDFGSNGYYSLLGLQYGCQIDQIPAAFRRAALRLHPDHQHEQTLVSDDVCFESLQTARAVLSDPDCKAGYDRILYLRTVLHQHDDANDELDPWLMFSINKLNRNNRYQYRILLFDLINKTVSNYKKSQLRKTIDFDQIREIVSISKHEVRVQIGLSASNQTKQYTWRCRTDHTRSRLESLLISIWKGQYHHLIDDRIMPQRSYLKGRITVRKDWKGGLGSNWRPRYVMIGATNLIIFADDACEHLIDCISLCDVVIGASAGLNNIGRSRTLPLFWRHDQPGPRDESGIDPALILKFDSVSNSDQWRALLERILARTNTSDANSLQSPLRPLVSIHAKAIQHATLSIESAVPDEANISRTDPLQEELDDGSSSDFDIDAEFQGPSRKHLALPWRESVYNDPPVPDRAQSQQLRHTADKGDVPLRAQSEQLRYDSTNQDDNIILRLMTVRDEISHHRRRLNSLLRLEKELAAERERQLMSQKGGRRSHGGFLTDLAHRLQSLFNNQTRLI